MVLCSAGTWNDATQDPADVCKTCPDGTTTDAVTTTPVGILKSECKVVLPGWGHKAATVTGDAPTKRLDIMDNQMYQCAIGETRSETVSYSLRC